MKKPADHFADVRAKLAAVWAKPEIDRWLAKEHQNLGMRSPAHMIHNGGHDAVHSIADEILAGRRHG